MAWQVYGDSLGEILSLALAGYKGSSGLDDLTPLYPNTAGHQVLPILRQALLVRWPEVDFGQSELCVELCPRLLLHLNHYLLRRLVFEHSAPLVLCDALFGADVGW
ncbi:hypothetical protein T3A99_23705 [Pseudomonas sp. N-137]|nr:hypothetical protein [Pseudomonas sp. N-137]MEA1031576.1 hypothetical protein [Pseudomonas sp. N-137]